MLSLPPSPGEVGDRRDNDQLDECFSFHALQLRDGDGLGSAFSGLNACIDAVQGAVASDDKVTLPGFGSFSRSSRAARTGRNPRTGEPVQIAASKGVKFSAGAAFKAAVNK